MKFLLVAVNAKYIHSNPAIYSLRAFAGETLSPYVDIAEYTINNRPSEILADLYSRAPEVIGFSCYIWNWNMIREVLTELPKILPHTDIWLGGPEVSYSGPEVLKRFPRVKGIMVGEGEATFKELLEIYVRGKVSPERLAGCRGLCLPAENPACDRNRQPATITTPARELLDLNKIPFPYRELRDFENRIIYYETSRGCPFRCSYCLSAGECGVRFRDTSVIKKELQFFLDHRVKQVKFVDRTFNCRREHTMEVWRYLQENDNGVTNFHFEVAAELLGEEELAFLGKMRPGQIQLEIGVQSANPETLLAVDRRTDMEHLETVVSALHTGRNIHLHLDLIAGLPHEDYESFGRSFDRVYGMKPDQLQLGFLKVLRGSPLAERTEEWGIRSLENPPYEVLSTNWLTYGELLQLKAVEELVEIYYNSGQFRHVLPFLEQCFPGPFSMYETMASYFKQKGFFINSPARAYRYEILLDFALETDPGNGELYRELLRYDMYLRENLKSRPAFAPELTQSERNRVRELYQTEEQERRLLPAYREYDARQLARMTHMEPFRYPVWDEEAMTAQRVDGNRDEVRVPGQSRYLLFDYADRNPLNREAATYLCE